MYAMGNWFQMMKSVSFIIIFFVTPGRDISLYFSTFHNKSKSCYLLHIHYLNNRYPNYYTPQLLLMFARI